MVADLVVLLGSARVVDLDTHMGRLLPAVALGFGLQVLTRLLEVGWPARVVALNLGVALRTLAARDGWLARTGWWLVGLSLGSFVLLALVALVWNQPNRALRAHRS